MNITIAKFEQYTKIVNDGKNVRHFNKNYHIITNEITVKINRGHFLFQGTLTNTFIRSCYLNKTIYQ